LIDCHSNVPRPTSYQRADEADAKKSAMPFVVIVVR
jgi:hypothetical protein